MVMSRENHVFQEHIKAKKKLGVFDTIVIIASFMYPLSGLPQVVQIFQGTTEGVSLYSWVSFLVFAIIFLTYGLKHRITPMIITNSIWIVVDGLVVIGYLLHS
jgi:uncharacterized protein with PQ loop repeat